MKLRIVRTYVKALIPGTIPIYGPGSSSQYFDKAVDTLQYYDDKEGKWINVPIVTEE